MTNNRSLGTEYEELAARKLEKESYTIVQMNYRCRIGEIDIIARDGNVLVFCEVKYRKNDKTGGPELAVNFYKARKICKVASYYMMTHHMNESSPVRFDVVAILGDDIRIYRNAFEYIE